VILQLETESAIYPIEIAAEKEPFSEMRALIRQLRDERNEPPKRVVCDREARHWMDVHAMKLSNQEIFHHSLKAEVFQTTIERIPVAIMDFKVRFETNSGSVEWLPKPSLHATYFRTRDLAAMKSTTMGGT
jgi:hypothetical protein